MKTRFAIALAGLLQARDPLVDPFATQRLGTLVGPRLGCSVWNGIDPGLDLAALCLRAS